MCAGNVRKSVGDTTKRQKEEENQRMRKGPDVHSEKMRKTKQTTTVQPPTTIHTTLTEHRVAILDSVVCLFCRIWMDRGTKTFLKFVPRVDATHLVEKMH